MKNTCHIPKSVAKKLERLYPDSDAVFRKAAESMKSKADRCTCEVPINAFYIRIPGTYRYKCTRCRKVVSPLARTPLGRDHKGLTETVDLACRYYFAKKELPPVVISGIYRCKYETAKRKSDRVVKWIKLAVSNKVNSDKINNTKVIKLFSSSYDDFASAIDALFHALPSLGETIDKLSK